MVNFAIAIEQPGGLKTLKQIAELLPISYTSLFRYYKYGHKGIKLETQPLGRKRVTTLEEVQRFSERLARLEEPAPPVTPRDRNEDFRRELKEQHGL